jgi:hypothetical protein
MRASGRAGLGGVHFVAAVIAALAACGGGSGVADPAIGGAAPDVPVASGGGADGGGTGTGSPDGGSAGSDGGSAWDPASLDPRIVAQVSAAPQCAALAPRDPAGQPVRILRAFTGSSSGCSGGATASGQGDVAFACISAFPERGWNDLFSPSATPAGSLDSWTLAAPTPIGFVSLYTPFGTQTASFDFAFRDASGWHSTSDSAPVTTHRSLFAHSSAGILELWLDDGNGSGPGTRWVDARGTPIRPPRSWRGVTAFGPFGVDATGHALVTYRTSANPTGDLLARWLAPDDTAGTEFTVPDPAGWSGPVEALAASGLVFGRAFVVASGATHTSAVPDWLAPRLERVVVIAGGRGYAFGKMNGDAPSDPTVRVYAQDGTPCGTVDFYGPGDTNPQLAEIGADGTLVQSVPAGRSDANGNPQTLRRWWTGLFR